MPKQKKSFLTTARNWTVSRKLFGNQAFLRYVMLHFLEALNTVSEDFVFKGGNLLWLYIGTPRATVDLDLATIVEANHDRVRDILEEVCKEVTDITYRVLEFKKVTADNKSGAAVTILFETKEGAKNKFEVDIVYALPTDFQEIQAPIQSSTKLKAATVENIIVDKLSAAHKFKGGNTRLKDFDDLWRLSKSETTIDRTKLRTLSKERSIPLSLDEGWINDELKLQWTQHITRYKDLPPSLENVFDDVTNWLRKL